MTIRRYQQLGRSSTRSLQPAATCPQPATVVVRGRHELPSPHPFELQEPRLTASSSENELREGTLHRTTLLKLVGLSSSKPIVFDDFKSARF
jgi:hypothetical protein